MKKNPYFAHKQCKDEDEDASDCNLRTSSETYTEIFKFEKPRGNTYQSALHSEMKKFAVSKFWSKGNKYLVLKEEDIFIYNREKKIKLRADLLASPLYCGSGKPIQRTEQYIFEGQTMKNPLSIKHIEKAIEYKKAGFLEDNIINAYSIDHLNRATYISDNYIDILNLKSLNRTEIDERINTNKEKRGPVINILEQTTVDKISGYYAFHADMEFLLAIKDYSSNHLLFMYIPITGEKNELEERNKNKRRLILTSVLDTITIKDDYCVIAYLYFKDITYITDINEYQDEVSMYKNKTIEFCQSSLRNIGEKYVNDINEKDKEISNIIKDNRILRNSINKIEFESQKLLAEKIAEINVFERKNSMLIKSLSREEDEISKKVEIKLRKELSSEHIIMEQLKNKYTSSYDEIAADVGKDVKEELDNKYNQKYTALTDGHTNMRKVVYCLREHIKHITSVENGVKEDIDSSIKCPNISLENYIKEYLQIQISKCAECKKYK